MILKITHDFVNQQIIDKLNEISYNRFYENMENGYSEFDVDYILDGKYKFNTFFKIRGSTISKDSEYFGKNLRTGKEIEFKIKRNNMPTLQELFDKWYIDYLKWLENDNPQLNICDDYADHM